MNFARIISLPLLFSFFTFIACKNKVESTENAPETEKPLSEKSTANKLERLDTYNMAALQKTDANYTEEGDCSTQQTTYEGDGKSFIVTINDCYDYGKSTTYLLFSDSTNLQMIHQKEITPYFAENDPVLYYHLAEIIVDYSNGSKTGKIRRDTIPQDSPASKVYLDKDFSSDPWIILNEKSDDYVLGEKIDYQSNWYPVVKGKLSTKLMQLDTLPATIPMRSNGTVGMGHRGEMRTLAEEILEEVVAIKEFELKKSVDHFQRSNKPFSAMKERDEMIGRAYWRRLMREK